jgi:23S rRNA (uracil1939-C5)-methyltransferase
MNHIEKNEKHLNNEAPLLGALIEGVIEKLASKGLGILRHKGFVIFVPFTIESELVLVEVVEVHKNFAFAKLLKVMKPSKHRILPKCPVFGICGGCQLQHMEYDHQVEYKKKIVHESLSHIAKINIDEIDIEPSNLQWGYRRYITLKRRGKAFGFIANDNKSFVEIDYCPIFDDKKIDIKPNQTKLFKSDNHTHTILNLNIQSSPMAFLQNHPEQSQMIYQEVVNQIKNINPKRVLDLYCGIGILSTCLAKAGIECLGVELNPHAIKLAKANAVLNGAKKIQFISAAVEAVIEKLKDYEVVIINPPRTGMDKSVIDSIKKMAPPHLFYISCMPQTLARDVNLLGYKVRSGKIYDMFPQTYHVETLLHLSQA